VTPKYFDSRCHEANLHFYKPATKPRLTEAQKAARLQFGRENIHREPGYWNSVFWSDEKTWRSDTNGRVSLWRRPGTR